MQIGEQLAAGGVVGLEAVESVQFTDIIPAVSTCLLTIVIAIANIAMA